MDYYTTKLVNRPDACRLIRHIVESPTFGSSNYATMAATILASKRPKVELVASMFNSMSGRPAAWYVAFVKHWTPEKDWGVRTIVQNFDNNWDRAMLTTMLTLLIRVHGDTFLAHYTHLPGQQFKDEWKHLFCIELVVGTIYGAEEASFRKTMEKVLRMGHLLTIHVNPERYQFRYLYAAFVSGDGAGLFKTSAEVVEFLASNWGSNGRLCKYVPRVAEGVDVDSRIRIVEEILRDVCAMAPTTEALDSSRTQRTGDDEEEEAPFVGGRVIMYRDNLGDIFNWNEHSIANEYTNPEKELPKIRKDQAATLRDIKMMLSAIHNYIVGAREIAFLPEVPIKEIEDAVKSGEALDYVPEEAQDHLKHDLMKLKTLVHRRDENQKRIDDFEKRLGLPALSPDVPELPKRRVVKRIIEAAKASSTTDSDEEPPLKKKPPKTQVDEPPKKQDDESPKKRGKPSKTQDDKSPKKGLDEIDEPIRGITKTIVPGKSR